MKTDKMRLIEYERNKPLEQLLTEWTDAGLTHRQMARELGISEQALHDWKRLLGAKTVTSITFEREPAVAA